MWFTSGKCKYSPFDVRALFTNIPQEEGALATEEAFKEREIQIIPTEFIVSMLQLILQNKIFSFDNELYF